MTKETRIDAETMPGPLQYGIGVIAFATDLMISQTVTLKRTAQRLKIDVRTSDF